MTFHNLNVLSILVAALSAFVVGGLWYSPLRFGAAWKRADGFGPDEPAGSPVKTFVLSYVLTVVMSLDLDIFLNDPKTNMAWGATAGLLAGFGWVAMGIGVVSLFERRPLTYILINGGYLTVALVLMGAILGGWR